MVEREKEEETNMRTSVPIIDCFDNSNVFLSNFFCSPVEHEGLVYPSIEHAFQAAKTSDHYLRITIKDAKTPGEAKRMGRNLKLREDWEEVKISIMKDLLREKFSSGTLFKRLIDTGEAILIEGNHWHDNFWGNCTCDRCKDIEGQNQLGKLLMEIRKGE